MHKTLIRFFYKKELNKTYRVSFSLNDLPFDCGTHIAGDLKVNNSLLSSKDAAQIFKYMLHKELYSQMMVGERKKILLSFENLQKKVYKDIRGKTIKSIGTHTNPDYPFYYRIFLIEQNKKYPLPKGITER